MRKTYGVNRDGWWVLANLLEGETVHGDFVHGPVDFNPDRSSLRGRNVTPGASVPWTGVLPEPHRREFVDTAHRGALRYVIYSYATPIAWLTTEEWVVPDVTYSVTTSKHQSRVRPAVSRVQERAAKERSYAPGADLVA